MEEFEFHLDHFSGPMDLMRHLIEKNRIDIYDIPIAELSAQYIAYLEHAESMNLEVTSNFLLFAAQLVRIKVRMLLPKHRDTEEDPRLELVQQLLEYQFFQDASERLTGLSHLADQHIPRPVQAAEPEMLHPEPPPIMPLDVTLLRKAMMALVEKAQEEDLFLTVERRAISIEALMDELMTACRLEENGLSFFKALNSQQERDVIVSLFLAMLECIRLNKIEVVQMHLFDDIWMYETA